jgi:DNA-binding transcriptional MocR family regulator
MDGNGICYPSYRALMDETGLSRQAIASNLKKLVADDWLEYETGDKALSQANTYFLNLEKLGFTTDTTVVPLPNRSKYVAVDGSEWECASDYWKSRHSS